MLRRLRNHLGVPGILAIVALVFATMGGAYAASDPGEGKATASAKGKRGKPGRPGKRGPTGPAGPVGAQGPAGANGAKGDTGAQGPAGQAGENGAAGKDGKGVVVTPVDGSEFECEAVGGAIVEKAGEPASAVEVCNGAEGEQGEQGEQGQPWVPENVLPEGATLTGGWSFAASDADNEAIVPLSFALPLDVEAAVALPASKVHYQTQAGFATNCTGDVVNPKAAAGHLCVYFNSGFAPENATFDHIFPLSGHPLLEEPGSSRSGANLRFLTNAPAGETAWGSGSFAVTGPVTP